MRRNTGLRRVVENVSWLFTERATILGLNFAVSVWFINYLGAAQYGRYAYVVSFAALFGALANLGLDTIVVRELSKQGAARGEILGTAFLMRLGSSAITVSLVAGTIFLVTDDAQTRLLVVIVAASIIADPAQVVDLWFQSRIQSKYVVWMRAGVALASLLAKAALIVMHMPLIAFAWLYTAHAIALGLGLIAVFAARRPVDLTLRRSARRAWLLLGDSWPLIVAGLSVTVYMKIDRIMLGELLGDQDVGTYSTAATISEVWNFFPVAIASSLFPIVVRSKEGGDPQLYARRMQALYNVMALMGYTVALLMTLGGVWIIDSLFTSEFGESARILQIHIWSLVFVALGVARSRYLITENRIRFAMMATLVGGVLNVLLNWILIPHAGGVGAALATLVSYSVAAYFSGLFVREIRPTTAQMTRALLAPLRPRRVLSEIRSIL